jgi:hypothetical protein
MGAFFDSFLHVLVASWIVHSSSLRRIEEHKRTQELLHLSRAHPASLKLGSLDTKEEQARGKHINAHGEDSKLHFVHGLV